MAKLKKRRVLVVEDEVLVAMMIARAFEREGAVVRLATSVGEAMAAVDEPTDAAVLDVRLPDGEVFPVADRLVDQDTPIVFHSAHLDQTRLTERYGEAPSVSKPASPDKLIEALARQLSTDDE